MVYPFLFQVTKCVNVCVCVCSLHLNRFDPKAAIIRSSCRVVGDTFNTNPTKPLSKGDLAVVSYVFGRDLEMSADPSLRFGSTSQVRIFPRLILIYREKGMETILPADDDGCFRTVPPRSMIRTLT